MKFIDCYQIDKILEIEHCGSCHSDWDRGYSLPSEEYFTNSEGEEICFLFCCGAFNIFRKNLLYE